MATGESANAKQIFMAWMAQQAAFKNTPQTPRSQDCHRQMKVYTDYDFLDKHLDPSKYCTTQSIENADFIFVGEHIQDFSSYPQVLLNQYPGESCLTSKNLLADMAHSVSGRRGVTWMPLTYNTSTEWGAFVKEWTSRNERGEENSWIARPWQSSRCRGVQLIPSTCTPDEIEEICAEKSMLLSKYDGSPPLLGDTKFDLRYYVLVKHTEPMEVYVHSSFYARFAPKPFDLNDLVDRARHLTTEELYDDPQNRDANTASGHEFVSRFCQEGQCSWEPFHDSIHAVLANLFKQAAPRLGNTGWALKCRGLYGVDIMMVRTETVSNVTIPTTERVSEGAVPDPGALPLRPLILEVNYSPDPTTMLMSCPGFYNDVMDTFLRDEPPTDVIRIL